MHFAVRIGVEGLVRAERPLALDAVERHHIPARTRCGLSQSAVGKRPSATAGLSSATAHFRIASCSAAGVAGRCAVWCSVALRRSSGRGGGAHLLIASCSAAEGVYSLSGLKLKGWLLVTRTQNVPSTPARTAQGTIRYHLAGFTCMRVRARACAGACARAGGCARVRRGVCARAGVCARVCAGVCACGRVCACVRGCVRVRGRVRARAAHHRDSPTLTSSLICRPWSIIV